LVGRIDGVVEGILERRKVGLTDGINEGVDEGFRFGAKDKLGSNEGEKVGLFCDVGASRPI